MPASNHASTYRRSRGKLGNRAYIVPSPPRSVVPTKPSLRRLYLSPLCEVDCRLRVSRLRRCETWEAVSSALRLKKKSIRIEPFFDLFIFLIAILFYHFRKGMKNQKLSNKLG